MKHHFFKKIFFVFWAILGLIIAGCFLINDKLIKAQSDDDDVYAWSENIGWISLRGESYQVVFGLATGKLSGYAWSENIGWVSFEENDLEGCPSGSCQAKINFSTGEVSGWARVLSYAEDGDDENGWINLGPFIFDDINYGIKIDSNGQFSGFAWGSDDIGWIKFYETDLDETLGEITDFEVTPGYCDQPGERIPVKNPTDGREEGGLIFEVEFDYSGDLGADNKYHLEINGDDFYHSISPVPFYSNNVTFILNETTFDSSDYLTWGKEYSFKVILEIDGKTINSYEKSVELYGHSYPYVSFSPTSDVSPPFGQLFTFYGTESQIYVGGTPSYEWSVSGNATIVGATDNATSSIKFFEGGGRVTLKVTDGDDKDCSLSSGIITPGYSLPKFKEIAPFL